MKFECVRVIAQKRFYSLSHECSFAVVDLTQDSNNCDKENVTKELEPELLECISKLLDDKCKQVQITAAITLCSYKSSEPKVNCVLTHQCFMPCCLISTPILSIAFEFRPLTF